MQTESPNEDTGAVWSPDSAWTPQQWQALVEELINDEVVTWKDVAALVLGQLNPPQVGTSLASNKAVQAVYGQRTTWQAVKSWFYEQTGRCSNCGTRLDLQVDHTTPLSPRRGLRGLHRLENYSLLCRRCNVVKRPSHRRGGVTFLTAEAALMWLLFVYRPESYEEFKQICRRYGLTMADIRFQESWAMAEWLKKEGKYP